MSYKGFFAYPANPKQIGFTIEEAIHKLKESSSNYSIESWKALDIVGSFISSKVLNGIDDSDFLVADITKLNFNVTYEVGYAIGKQKKILLTKNSSINGGSPSISEVGIFDTLGYKEYQNSDELKEYLSTIEDINPIPIKETVDQKSPVYLLESQHKTDLMTRIISRIKKSRYIFRNFDPSEQSRLSATDAIKNVAKSYGVVIPLLGSHEDGYELHNQRASFIAGLSHGLGKAVKILQFGEDPVPLDYRDFVNICNHPDDINEYIADFAADVAELYQQTLEVPNSTDESFLEKLDLGASSAENEMRTLQSYYLKTDQYLKSIRGEANLVVGRKGAGKSAIFLQVRDRERSNKQNIVLDLKPDGYKLIKFKELILEFLEEGTLQHTIMAFWEYLLLLEICYKILEKDKIRHMHDQNLFEPYRKLEELYNSEEYNVQGDFSERMKILMEKISSDYAAKYSKENKTRLSSAQVTELLYSHDVREISKQIKEYMRYKETLWLLFDNIDKGWPTTGLTHEDLIIIRSLIDACRKLERQFDRQNTEVHTIVFLRNDVYELLVSETSDRGKEASVLLDWTDTDLLRELIRLRVISNGLDSALSFDQVWSKICISHYKGEESSQYLIDRSLMRPRFLLNLIGHCKSYAVNLNHSKITEQDIEKGLAAFSMDLLSDIGYELKDISSESDGILYAFIESKKELSLQEINQKISPFVSHEQCQKMIDLLLWYGFFGIKDYQNEERYIYHYHYNMNIMKGFISQKGGNLKYCINPAFYKSLMIK